MNSRFNVVIILLTFILNIASAEIHVYEEILEHSFKTGSGKNEIGSLSGEDAIGVVETNPSCMTFSANDNLIIADTINNRIIFFEDNYSVKKIYKDEAYVSASLYIKDLDDLLVGTIVSSRIFVLNKSTERSIELTIPYEISTSSTVIVPTEKVLFSYLSNGSICSYILEDDDDLLYSARQSDTETHKLFENKAQYKLEQYSLDVSNRIFYSQKIQNIDYKTLYDFWMHEHKSKNLKSPRDVPGVPSFNKLNDLNARYIGTDRDGNTYWYLSKAVIIFDKSGWALDYFIFNIKPLMAATVNSSGDVLYLAKRKGKKEILLDLYKIQRQW